MVFISSVYIVHIQPIVQVVKSVISKMDHSLIHKYLFLIFQKTSLIVANS